MDIRDKAAPSTLEVGLRRALLPALILGALAQTAHGAAVDPADPAAALDPASPAAIDPAAPALGPDPAAASAISFDQDFFPVGHAPKVDISRFEKGNVVLPGTYRGDITLNNAWRARGDITFAAVAGKDSAQLCFDASMLTRWGVDLRKVASHADPDQIPSRPIPATGQFCGPIGDYIPGATATFDSSDLALALSVPQIYTLHSARGYVDPSQWDAGIDAGVLNYNANVYRSSGRANARTSGYLGVNGSLNLGAWHLVHQGSASWTEHDKVQYQNTATYVQHDIPAWKAQAAAGDVFTAGDIFDSVRLSGVRLYTDERMLPDSQRGFAPVVRGVATSNAKVRVKQRGYVIYETTVAPGPFVIDDLYPTGYGGDLDVEVTEADGRIERFTVPYAAVPQLLRPGQERWEFAAGKINQMGMRNTPFVGQLTYRRGLTNAVSVYGGASFATAWHNLLVGGALNTDFGAFSADITQGRNKVPGQKGTTGLSYRIGYNKNIVDTGTNFAVAAYRYSTNGFVGLNDSVAMRNAVARGLGGDYVPRPRNRIDASVYQTLGQRGGQVYFTGSASNYWNRAHRQVSFSAGYSNNWRSLTYSFTAQRTRDRFDTTPLFASGPVDRIPGVADPVVPRTYSTRSDTTLWLTLSVPLGTSSRAPMFSSLASHSSTSGNSAQVGVSGSFDEDRRFNYNASLSHAGSSTTGGLYGQYNGGKGNVTAGFSHGSGYNQASAGASGSVVVHRGGVTLGPPSGDTIGLVYAPGAEGADVQGSIGGKVDSRGYAIATSLTPYQLNTVSLDPKGTAASVELDSTTQNVAPRAGSVVRLNYKTSVGRALLIDSAMQDGSPLPFGADVLDGAGNPVGVVGQAGRVFVHGLETSAPLTVRWGDEASDSCHIDVTLPPDDGKPKADYEKLQAAGVPSTQGPTAGSAPAAADPATPDKLTSQAAASPRDPRGN